MGFDNAFDDCQSQPAAGSGVAAPAVEPLEDMRQILRGDARPRIPDAHPNPLRIALQGNAHLPLRRGELEGVVHQVANRHLHAVTVAGQRHGVIGGLHQQGNPLLPGERLEGRHRRIQHGAQVAGGAVEFQQTGIQAGKVEQVAGDPRQPLDLGLALGQELGLRGGVVRGGALQQGVEIFEGGDRRAQFVRGVGDETAQGVTLGLQLADVLLKVVRHLVELLRQCADFPLALQIRPHRKVSRAHLGRGAGQAFEGRGDPVAVPQPQENRQQHRARPGDQQRPAEIFQQGAAIIERRAQLHVADGGRRVADGVMQHGSRAGAVSGQPRGGQRFALGEGDFPEGESLAPGAVVLLHDGDLAFRGEHGGKFRGQLQRLPVRLEAVHHHPRRRLHRNQQRDLPAGPRQPGIGDLAPAGIQNADAQIAEVSGGFRQLLQFSRRKRGVHQRLGLERNRLRVGAQPLDFTGCGVVAGQLVGHRADHADRKQGQQGVTEGEPPAQGHGGKGKGER